MRQPLILGLVLTLTACGPAPSNPEPRRRVAADGQAVAAPEEPRRVPPPAAAPAEAGDDRTPEPAAPDASPPAPPAPVPAPAPEPAKTFDDARKAVSEEALRALVTHFASKELAGRGSGSDTNEQAAKLIVDRLTAAGARAGFGDTYLQRLPVSSGKGYTSNVVGIFPGNDPAVARETIVIGGHFDHLGKRGNTIYPGADDNASGAATVVTIAGALGLVKDQLRRTVVVIGFSGEELGLLGSEKYADAPAIPLADTVYMINLDMVGRLSGGGRLSFLGGSSSPAGEAAIRRVMGAHAGLPHELTRSSGGGSDHVPFRDAGVPVVFLHTGLHDDYHEPSDTADKIDYAGLHEIAVVALELLWDVAQADEAPARLRQSYGDVDDRRLDHGGRPFSGKEDRP